MNLLIKNKWEEIALGFGAIIMFWSFIIGPFNTSTTRKSTLRETVETVELTQKKFELVRDAASPFEELYSFRLTEDVADEVKTAIEIVNKIWTGAPDMLKFKINFVIYEGNASAFGKLLKDTTSLNNDILPSNAVYFFNNRSQEAAFVTLKRNDSKFLRMLRSRLGDVAVCQINKLRNGFVLKIIANL